MWPWTSKEPAQDDLKSTVTRLERDIKLLRLEWDEVLDKVLHRLQRQNKRDRDALTLSQTNDLPAGHAEPTPHRHPKADLYARAAARGLHVRS